MKVIIAAEVILNLLNALDDNHENYHTVKQLWSQIIIDHKNTYYVISLSWQIIHYKLSERYKNPKKIIQKLQEKLNCLHHEELPGIAFGNFDDEYIDAVEGSYMVAYAIRNGIKSIVTARPVYSIVTIRPTDPVYSVVRIYSLEGFLMYLLSGQPEDLIDDSDNLTETEVAQISLHQLLQNYDYYPPG